MTQFKKPEPIYLDSDGDHGVLLLHAYSGSSNDMLLLGNMLNRNGYAVYMPIFAGHGTLEPKNIFTKGSIDQWLEDALNAFEFLKNKKKKISVFGLSMGGFFATKLMELKNHDIVSGGTFSSPILSLSGNNVPQNFLKFCEKAYHRQGLPEDEIKTNLEWLNEANLKRLSELSAFVNEVGHNLIKINNPFFIGQGTGDTMINPQSGRILRYGLVELNKTVEIHEYKDADHVLTVNIAHKTLEEDVLNFLNKY